MKIINYTFTYHLIYQHFDAIQTICLQICGQGSVQFMFNYLSYSNYTKLLPSVYLNSKHLVLSHLALSKKVMLRANFYFSFNQHFFSFLEMDS